MNKPLWGITVAIVLIISAVVFYQTKEDEIDNGPILTGPVGEALMSIGEAQTLEGVTITPLEVVEDSRCAQDVQCIWAGTVKVRANISKPSGNFTQVLELNQPFNTGTETITVVGVTPSPTKAGESIESEDYKFEFDVVRNTQTVENPGVGGCFVGGCSGQICSDEAGAVSTCEYREEYACYKAAKCERQSSGQCGWTQTTELQMCLGNVQ